MHILFLTDNFPPEVNAPASRTYEHCREWVRQGLTVTVITCVPNFPNGKVFIGYRNRVYQHENIDGIKVVRVWSYIASNEGFLKRILDYMSYMMSASFFSLFIKKVDLVIGTSPQFFTVSAAYLVSRYKGIPFIFELRDIWPESIKAVGAMKDNSIIRLLERLEMFLYSKSSLIVSVTHSFKQILINRGIPHNKICVITNGVDTRHFYPLEKDHQLLKRMNLYGKFVIGYFGTHGMAHALGTILDAAKKIKTVPNGNKVQFIMIGDGARKEDLKALAKKENLDNVIFIDSVSKSEITRYWSLLDVSVIHLRKAPLFLSVIPSKLFESMGMGIPVLNGVEGESAEIVKSKDIGICFEPEKPKELVNAIMTYLHSPKLINIHGYNGRLLAEKKYDREILARKLMGRLFSDFASKIN